MRMRTSLLGAAAILLALALCIGAAQAAGRTAGEAVALTSVKPEAKALSRAPLDRPVTLVRIYGEIININAETSPRTITLKQLRPAPVLPVIPRVDVTPERLEAAATRTLNVADDATVQIGSEPARFAQLQPGWHATLVIGANRTVVQITANPPVPPVRPVPPPVEPQPVTLQGWLVRLPGGVGAESFGLVVATAPLKSVPRALEESLVPQPRPDATAAVRPEVAPPSLTVRGMIALTTSDRAVYQAMERCLGCLVSVTGTWRPNTGTTWGRMLNVSAIALAE